MFLFHFWLFYILIYKQERHETVGNHIHAKDHKSGKLTSLHPIILTPGVKNEHILFTQWLFVNSKCYLGQRPGSFMNSPYGTWKNTCKSGVSSSKHKENKSANFNTNYFSLYLYWATSASFLVIRSQVHFRLCYIFLYSHIHETFLTQTY